MKNNRNKYILRHFHYLNTYVVFEMLISLTLRCQMIINELKNCKLMAIDFFQVLR